MIKYYKCSVLWICLEVENLDKKFKSLRSGKSKTIIPQFQAIKKTKKINEGDRKANNEHTNNQR